jgi:hypothetical protein
VQDTPDIAEHRVVPAGDFRKVFDPLGHSDFLRCIQFPVTSQRPAGMARHFERGGRKKSFRLT